MTQRTQERVVLFIVLVAIAAACGPIYGLIFIPEWPFSRLWPMAVDGLIGGALFWGGIVFLWPSRFSAPLRRLAFPWHVLFLCVYVAISIPVSGAIGNLFHSDRPATQLHFGPGWSLFFYILAVATTILIAIQIAQVIGPRILGNMLIGRYHVPVEEKRIFLFIDLAGSTMLARQLGDLGVQRLLTRFFFDLGQPVAEHGGEIHAYIGDEVIVTWPFKKGAADGRCVRCYFAIRDLLASRAETYENLFGVTPQIRAGLHGGPVVISECGDAKKSIVYFGDTMNTSARLESEAKRLERDLVVSRELLQAMSLPADFKAEPMEDVVLRGHDHPTGLAALSRLRT